ncbi:hypothetical protein OAN96_00605 [Candidatus Gracilibacteria bacterium]|nr:hypothetical protein [Candidatus Gracilibacteria bacterium]
MTQETQKLYEGIRKVKQDLVNKLENRRSKKNFVVLIAGGSASGKTSLIAERIQDMYKKDSLILSMDNYYKGTEYVKKHKLSFDDPEALDIKLFRKHLKALKAGETIKSPVYSFKKSVRTDKTTTIRPKKIIIVEGLYALHDNLHTVGDYKVFVDLGTHGRLLRRIFRDVHRTGQYAKDIFNYFTQVVEPKNYQHIEPTKKNADVVISNKYIAFVESRSAGMDHKQMQIKFEMKQSEAMQVYKVIHSLGGIYAGSHDCEDYFFSPGDLDLHQTDEIVKVSKAPQGKYLFSYRGPKDMHIFYESRYGIDFFVTEKILKQFKKLYGNFKLKLKKNRTNFYLDGLLISMDHFKKQNQCYLHIHFAEGFRQKTLRNLLDRLGLDYKKGIKKSYFELMDK